MTIDRRLFLAGSAAALAAGPLRAAIIAPGASAAQARALAAIAAYLEAHRQHYDLPALGMVVVDGPFTAFILSGSRDYAGRQPVTPNDLWQIGSISKSFVALLCFQLAAAGTLDLDADIRTVLPEAPLPGGAPFTIRGLLDHTTGLPDFAPEFEAPLWRGFEPGSHWSYSNTGYNLVGHAIARVTGQRVSDVLEQRICQPLGMTATRGAIRWADRAHHVASYTPLRPDRPVLQQTPLAPAPWVDADLAAGSVTSSLTDMARYLRFLIAAGTGQGAPLISDAAARAWTAAPVVEDPAKPEERYGLGLMHRPDEGRLLLHHTGGMISFSSSFHVDAAGTGAFASCAVGGINYRPRLLTRFAAKAMRLARAGQPLPPPPEFPKPALSIADFAGGWSDGTASLTIAGNRVDAAGVSGHVEAAPEPWLVSDHPLLAFPLLPVRGSKDGPVVALDCGRRRLVRAGATAPALPPTPDRLSQRAGRYQSDDPWIGGVTLVARGDQLLAEGVQPLVEIGGDVWRAAEPDWSPERLHFLSPVDGRPQLINFSGRTLTRRDS